MGCLFSVADPPPPAYKAHHGTPTRTTVTAAELTALSAASRAKAAQRRIDLVPVALQRLNNPIECKQKNPSSLIEEMTIAAARAGKTILHLRLEYAPAPDGEDAHTIMCVMGDHWTDTVRSWAPSNCNVTACRFESRFIDENYHGDATISWK